MAFPTSKQILPGYNSPVGDKYLVIFDTVGPASYSRTTGFVITAASLGMGGFDYVVCSCDSGNNFDVCVQFNLGGIGNAVPSIILRPIANATATVGGQSQTAGTEAAASTNLSALSFRLFCWMV